jgi:hypothetical protein
LEQTYYLKIRAKTFLEIGQIDYQLIPLYASLYVNFNWQPQRPTIGQVVPCQSWDWQFPGGDPSSIGQKTVFLRARDSSNYECTNSAMVAHHLLSSRKFLQHFLKREIFCLFDFKIEFLNLDINFWKGGQIGQNNCFW